jgi:phosphoglycolate phosphatase
MMGFQMAIKLIVFDLDGTLVDSNGDLADSVNELRRKLRLRRLPETTVGGHVGQGVGHLLKMTVPEVSRGFTVSGTLRARHPDLYEEFRKIYFRRCLNRTRLYAGVRRALEDLGASRLAVATNKPVRVSNKILRGLGVKKRFAAIMGGDSVKHRKPHPEVLHTLMRRFRARPSETVMVGDSRFDMETGRRARVRLVGCLWGFGTRAELRPWKPDVTIKAARDLPKAIAALNR